MITQRKSPPFISANEISISSIVDEQIILSAPGFHCELKPQWSGIRFSLTTGPAEPLADTTPQFFVKTGHETIALFTSENEAQALVTNIVEALKVYRCKTQKPEKSFVKSRLSAFVEFAVPGLFLAFFGAGVANIGWQAFTPAANKVAALVGVPSDAEVVATQLQQLSDFTAKVFSQAQDEHADKPMDKDMPDTFQGKGNSSADMRAIWQAVQRDYARKQIDRRSEALLPDADVDEREAALQAFAESSEKIRSAVEELYKAKSAEH